MKSGIQKKVVYKRKQCSKGKSPVWSSKEGSDAENKNASTRWHYYAGEGGPPKQDNIRQFRPPKLARPESAESRLGGHRCAHTGAGYVITIIIINLSCSYLSIICNAWSEGPTSMPTSPSKIMFLQK